MGWAGRSLLDPCSCWGSLACPGCITIWIGFFFLAELSKITALLPLQRVLLLLLRSLISVLPASSLRDKLSTFFLLIDKTLKQHKTEWKD